MLGADVCTSLLVAAVCYFRCLMMKQKEDLNLLEFLEDIENVPDANQHPDLSLQPNSALLRCQAQLVTLAIKIHTRETHHTWCSNKRQGMTGFFID